HADAEQPAEREQHHVAAREPAQKREQRVPRDRKENRPLASPAIGRSAGADATDDAEEERDGAEQTRERFVDREALLDVDQNEGQDGKIKAAEHPPEERGGKRFH